MDLPFGDRYTGIDGVDENLLPIQKAAHHFMSRKLDPQVLIQAEKDMLPTRMEPNRKSFEKYFSSLESYVKKNPHERIL
jgi:hypothetical protein